MADIAMACTVMAWIGMANIVAAYGPGDEKRLTMHVAMCDCMRVDMCIYVCIRHGV